MQSVSSVGALAVPWSASEARLALPAALGVAGIPALVLTAPGGTVLTVNGRTHLAADPLGLVSLLPAIQQLFSLALVTALGVAGIPALDLEAPGEDASRFVLSLLVTAVTSFGPTRCPGGGWYTRPGPHGSGRHHSECQQKDVPSC